MVILGNASHESVKNELDSLTSDKLPICIDFDGTCVYHHYPYIGKTIPGCISVLKKWTKNGVGLILDTMRDGIALEEAINWFKCHEIPLYGIGGTPDQKSWTSSGKAYGIFSIDDRNLGCPLKTIPGERPFVDWYMVDELYSDFIIKLAKHYK